MMTTYQPPPPLPNYEYSPLQDTSPQQSTPGYPPPQESPPSYDPRFQDHTVNNFNEPHPTHTGYQPVPQRIIDNSPTIIYVNRTRPTQSVVQDDNDEINHLFHCIICLLFPPWILVWLCLCFLYHGEDCDCPLL